MDCSTEFPGNKTLESLDLLSRDRSHHNVCSWQILLQKSVEGFREQ